VSPRRFTVPVVGAGGCRPFDLHGLRTWHGRGVRGAAWAGSNTHGVRDRVPRCSFAFWSGIRNRPSSGGGSPDDTSGADA
jgi:hypothetical protein